MGRLTHMTLVLLVLIFALSLTCEARKWKREKEQKTKDHHHHDLTKKHNHVNKEVYPSYKEKSHMFHQENHKHGIELYDASRSGKHKLNKAKEGKMKKLKQKLKKGKKQKHRGLDWMEFKPESECIPKCGQNEICISGPIDAKTLCVKKRNLKKSIKLFHRYQKKEMKEWRKFKKDHYNDVYDEKKHWKDEKHHHGHDMKKQHLKKPSFDHMMKKKAGKHQGKPHAPSFVDDKNECSTDDFGEMRTRMMGWFHVLHGQDHLMKKQKKGSLKHFHKHVSVKKELREHEGESCKCFKSAMWQFHELDENKDNVLHPKELRMVEENTLEPCVKPYLTSCDKDANGVLSSDEWCCCFSSVVAPCFKKLDEIRKSGDKLTYVPRCDKEGYYMREQCQGDAKESDSYGCWCVDYNGNEYEGTFTKGRAHCSKIAYRSLDKTPMI